MDKDGYLIPANSKKSSLILGFFTPIDLAIFLTGIVISMIALAIIHTPNFKIMLLIITPGLISTFLVLPVPYYHNVLQLITNIIHFLFNRRRYYWKGWCVSSEDEEK